MSSDTGSPGSPAAPDALPLHVTFWGTRGSIPGPGPGTVRFGGNTPCVEVRAGGQLLILDAGTGIRALGDHLAAAGEPVRAELFLSHFHWDHIQGLPFFAPLYGAPTRLRLHGAAQGGVGIRDLLDRQMSAAFFPRSLDSLPAELAYVELRDAIRLEGGVEVDSLRVPHPSVTHGFRVRSGGSSLAYVPDIELGGGNHRVPEGWRAALVTLLAGVDLLVLDAMFTEEEYREREGWGHSTFRQAVRLAEEAGVRRLVLFHHAPHRTDREILRIVDELRTELSGRGSPLGVSAAAEGDRLSLPLGG